MLDLDTLAFKPHRLLRGGHLQTIAAGYLSKRFPYRAKQHEALLDDGDRIVLHDDCPQQWRDGRRVVVLIHGLGGTHRSPYMMRLAAKLSARGVRAWRMDMRGCGAGIALARRTTHAGRSEDIAAALSLVHQLCPASPVTAIGFSLGASMLLKLLGEQSEAPPGLDSVVAVAPPVDLAHCAKNLRQGVNRLYDRSFVKSLLRHVRQRVITRPDCDDAKISLLPAPRTLYDFDDRFVAPQAGFTCADEYYQRCSAAPLLANIRTPTLIISADDDPLIPVDTFDQAASSSSVRVQFTAGGGHCGFFGAANGDPDRHWLDWRIIEAVTRLGEAN